MALGDVIARLSVSLNLETSSFERGSKRAQKEAESLGKKMTRIAGAVATAFVASIGVDTVRSIVDMGKAAVDSVGALGEQAQQLGVTTDALQEFRFVASQTGIEQAEIDKALQRLTRTIGELAEPTKAQAEAMKRLGLATDAFKGLDASEAMVVLSAAMNKLPDAATRSAVGFDLMGRTFQTLLPLLNEGPERIADMVKAAHDLGIVLTPEMIAAADSYADQIAALNASVDAQKAAALVKYGDGLVKLTRDYTQFQIDMVNAFVAIDRAGTGLTKTLQDFGKNTGIQDFFAAQNVSLDAIARAFRRARDSIVNSVSSLVSGVRNWLTGELNKVWAGVQSKIEAVRASFFHLYDAVVGHSYVPDMVDGIAAHMARLDAVMVKPAQTATQKTAAAFQDLRNLLDRLFPEAGKASAFNADLARLQGAGMTPAELDEAVARLWREYASGSPFGSGGMGEPDFSDAVPLTDGMDDVGGAIERLTERARIGTVQIAKSFKDMADETLRSLSNLGNAIKSGGFLDILQAAIGTGLQLAGMGAFGPGLAAKVNAVPGTASKAGAPKLVAMPTGSKIAASSATGSKQVVEIVDTTGLFKFAVNGQIVQAAPSLIAGGGKMGEAIVGRRMARALP